MLVLLIAGSLGVGFLIGTGNQRTITTTTTVTQTNVAVMRTDLTLTGEAAVVPCVGFNFGGCPSASNASLYPVELIKYGPSYYYRYNQSAPDDSGQTIEYTVWFTNSSTYCISPAHPFTNTSHQNPTCPTAPYAKTAISVPISSASSLNLSSGLRIDLQLSVNSGGGLIVTIDEHNTLDRVNNVTASDIWPIPAYELGPGYGGCDANYVPVGFAVLRGNYGPGNLTEAPPLILSVQPILFCPYFAPTPWYVFDALGNSAIEREFSSTRNETISYSETITGYWTGAFPSESTWFNTFLQGRYTAVAVDEWGQTAILHFSVVSR